MAQTDNTGPGEQGGIDRPHEQKNQRADSKWVANSLQHSRRMNLVRMLIGPVVLAVVLAAVLTVGRQILRQHSCENTLRELSQQISAFKEQHERLPNREEMLNFKLPTRISITNLVYEADHILPDSPGDTPLAYAPLFESWFGKSGHAVLYCDRRVVWLRAAELQVKLEQREQRYNQSILRRTP